MHRHYVTEMVKIVSVDRVLFILNVASQQLKPEEKIQADPEETRK